jgi:probable F420-dependent oxidoreductase
MTHRFRFGVLVETMGTAAEWIAKAQRAEALGYSTYLIRDHFVPDFGGYTYAPIAALTVAALSTSRLRVGTMVIDNDFRHPLVLGKEIATLDVLSGGRVELGLGAGWLQAEYTQMGIPYDEPAVRVSRLEEALQVYKGSFTQDEFSFTGVHYQVQQFRRFPAPVGKIPLLIGAGKQRMCRLAGREADIVGLMSVITSDGTVYSDPYAMLPHAVHQKLDWVRAGAGERFAQIELNTVAALHLTDNRQATAQAMIEDNHWQIEPDDVLTMPTRLIGTVPEVIQQIQQQRETYGLSYYVVSDDEMEQFAPVVAELAGC